MGIHKDAIYFPYRENKIPITWVSAEKNEKPEELLKVTDCEVGDHFIVRYKRDGKSWSIRRSNIGIKFVDGEEFLAVKEHHVYWEEVQNDKMPTNKYFIPGKSPEEPQKCTGKHHKYGVGYVTRHPERKNLALFYEHKSEDENIEIRCVTQGIKILCVNR